MVNQTAVQVYDGQEDFTGGQDASKTPEKVAPNAVFAAVNTTFKNGSMGPRDGFAKRRITFPEGALIVDGVVTLSFIEIFKGGKFQALIPYSINGTPYLIIVISGVIFLINQNTLVATVLTIPGGVDRLSEFAPRLNWSNASQFIVIFDYPNYPVIIDGFSARRANPALSEVPVSTIGAYNQNRLFIGDIANSFTAGDPTGSAAAPLAPITFLEIETIGSPYFGQVFQLPTDYTNDPITAMGFLNAVDTSTGIGPLIIATNNQIFSVNSQNPRATWQEGQFVSSIVSNSGIAGQQAMVNVNSDLFFLSPDGQLRTLSMSRDEQHKWTKVPISREVKNWLIYPDISLAKYASLGYFNNNIYVTANPYRTLARTLFNEPILDYANGGLVAIELDNISSLRGDSPPCWGGLWTGIRPMDLCNNFGRCFVISKDDDVVNNLWEITPDITHDTDGDKIRYIRSTIYSRSYGFQDSFTYKALNYIDLPFQNIRGDFSLDVKYKPGQSPKYLDWGTFSYNVPYRSCDFNTLCNFGGFSPHNLSELRIGSTNNKECDPVTEYLYENFRETQVKLTIEAMTWELPMFKMKATTIPQSDTDTDCTKYPTVAVCETCNGDWDIPPFDICVAKET